MPKISVIIPVYNRPTQIIDCLSSLTVQSETDCEIIVVNDGSNDETREALDNFKKSNPSPELKIIRNENNLGITKAKNVGIREASGELIVFTDSDCIADKDWLKNITAALSEADAVSGLVLDPKPRNLSERAFFGTSKIYQHPLQKRLLIEHNCGFRRDVISKYLFEEALDYGGEGSELAWRLKNDGFSFKFANSAIIYHHHPLDLKELLKIARKTGEGEAKYFYKKGCYLGRDVVFSVLALASLCLAAFSTIFLYSAFFFLFIQCLILVANEIYFKKKSLVESLITLPVNILYNFNKTFAMLKTIARILLGLETKISKV